MVGRISGKPNELRIHNDDKVTALNVRRVVSLVLAHQDGSDLSGKVTDKSPVGIDNEPVRFRIFLPHHRRFLSNGRHGIIP